MDCLDYGKIVGVVALINKSCCIEVYFSVLLKQCHVWRPWLIPGCFVSPLDFCFASCNCLLGRIFD